MYEKGGKEEWEEKFEKERRKIFSSLLKSKHFHPSSQPSSTSDTKEQTFPQEYNIPSWDSLFFLFFLLLVIPLSPSFSFLNTLHPPCPIHSYSALHRLPVAVWWRRRADGIIFRSSFSFSFHWEYEHQRNQTKSSIRSLKSFSWLFFQCHSQHNDRLDTMNTSQHFPLRTSTCSKVSCLS